MLLFRSLSFYLALLGIALTVFLTFKQSIPPPPPLYLVEPSLAPYERTIAASGIIESLDKNIEIGIPQSALVKNVYVKAGDLVQKGEPLFSLDDTELQAQLIVQKAHAFVQNTYLNRTKDQLKRFELVEDKRAISEEEFINRRHAVVIAQAEFELAQAQLEQTTLLIKRLTICAPKKGMILQSNIRPGEFVLTNASPSLCSMILGDVDHLQIRVDIDENNASKIIAENPAVAFAKHSTTHEINLHFNRIEPYVIPKRSLTGAGDERIDTRVLQVIYTFDKDLFFPLYVGQQMDVFIKQKPLENLAVKELEK